MTDALVISSILNLPDIPVFVTQTAGDMIRLHDKILGLFEASINSIAVASLLVSET